MENADVWKIIRKHFEDNPQCLVRHHIDSYNHFFKKDIYQIFKDSNPLKLQVNYDQATETYKQECLMYLGGKEGKKISILQISIFYKSVQSAIDRSIDLSIISTFLHYIYIYSNFS